MIEKIGDLLSDFLYMLQFLIVVFEVSLEAILDQSFSGEPIGLHLVLKA